MRNYYLWNAQLLADWLTVEISAGKSLRELADNLEISQDSLIQWLTRTVPAIRIEHIQSIAHYRNWSFERTVQWLGICSAHLAELKEFPKI